MVFHTSKNYKILIKDALFYKTKFLNLTLYDFGPTNQYRGLKTAIPPDFPLIAPCVNIYDQSHKVSDSKVFLVNIHLPLKFRSFWRYGTPFLNTPLVIQNNHSPEIQFKCFNFHRNSFKMKSLIIY